MNSYFSDFISRFGNGSAGLHSYSEVPDDEKTAPQISFATLYNPALAPANDESFEGLSRQILFFLTPHKQAQNGTNGNEPQLLRDQLNIVGLIRGSCALLSDLGSENGPFVIQIDEGAIVVSEIGQGYFLAICLLSGTDDTQQNNAVITQLSKLVDYSHRTFELLHRPIADLLVDHESTHVSEKLTSHWRGFVANFNLGNDCRFGPAKLQWPNRSNHRGFFDFLPGKGHKVSAIKLPESTKRELDAATRVCGTCPRGYVVMNTDSLSLKHRGILHIHLGQDRKLEAASVIDVANLMDTLNENCGLTPEALPELAASRDVFSLVSKQWQAAPDPANVPIADSQDEDTEDELDEAAESMFTPANALALLNPMTLTNSLVVQPLTGTVSGFKHLGLAVTEQLYDAPKWLNKLNYFGSSELETGAETRETTENANPRKDEFLIGPNGTQITRFSLHMPLISSDGSRAVEEHHIVAFKSGELLTLLFYESSNAEMGNMSFYSALKTALIESLDELVVPMMSDKGFPMSSSIGSLPEQINRGIPKEKHRKEIGINEIDNDFFFVIYDTVSQAYSTSLPNLPMFNPACTGAEKTQASLTRVLFHLHDRLVNHFILETKQQIFKCDSHTHEQLHKFSSSKSIDWLIYSMRHKEKVIIIMKNSTHKSKAKLPLDTQSGHLMKVADSIYAAANLGFMESLGTDVRAWLGGVESEHTEGESRTLP